MPGGAESVADVISFDAGSRRVSIEKGVLTPEETLAARFAGALRRAGVGYVIVGGFVAILFGRIRRSEDIDFLLQPVGFSEFEQLYRCLREEGFNPAPRASPAELYEKAMRGASMRFEFGGMATPYVDARFALRRYQRVALDNALTLVLGGRHELKIPPLELQIVYKLWLGSDKDVGDAVFLYTLLKDVLDHGELESLAREFGVDIDRLTGDEGR